MQLIVVRGPQRVGPFDLREGENVIGRAPECEVVLPSKRVSRRHAVVQVTGADVVVRDLESQNGLIDADGSRSGRLELRPGGRVQIGDYLLLLEAPHVEDLELEEEEDGLEIELEESTTGATRSDPFDPTRSLGGVPSPVRPRALGGRAPVPTPPSAPVAQAPAPLPAPPPAPVAQAPAPFAPARPTPAAPEPPQAAPVASPQAAPPGPPPALPFPPAASRPGGLPFAPAGAKPGTLPFAPASTPLAPPRPPPPPEEPSEISITPVGPGSPPPPMPPRVAPPPVAAPPGPPPSLSPPAPAPPAPLPPPPSLAPPRSPAPPPPPGLGPPPSAVPRSAPTVALPAADTTAGGARPGQDVASRVRGIPWIVQASAVVLLSVGLLLCAPLGGALSQLFGGIGAVNEASLLLGEQIADSLGNRNAQALAEQRAITLDAAFVLDRDGVRGALLTDARGTVLAPAEKLRTSIQTHAAFKDAVASHQVAREEGDEGTWEIVAPVRAQITAGGARQVVGYAVLEYDPSIVAEDLVSPWIGALASLATAALALGVLAAGGWWLLVRPLVALREETELALHGDVDRVAAPARLPELEQLAHSINRVLSRARAR